MNSEIKLICDKAVLIVLKKLIKLLKQNEFNNLSEFECFLIGLKDKFNDKEY